MLDEGRKRLRWRTVEKKKRWTASRACLFWWRERCSGREAAVADRERGGREMETNVMVARSVRDWRGVSMDRNVVRRPLPTTEQEEGFSLLVFSYFISHPLIT